MTTLSEVWPGFYILFVVFVAIAMLMFGYFYGVNSYENKVNDLLVELNSYKNSNNELQFKVMDLHDQLQMCSKDLEQRDKEILDLHRQLDECQENVKKAEKAAEVLGRYGDLLNKVGSIIVEFTSKYTFYGTGNYEYIECSDMDNFYRKAKITFDEYADFVKENCDYLIKYTDFYLTKTDCEEDKNNLDRILDYIYELKQFCDYNS